VSFYVGSDLQSGRRRLDAMRRGEDAQLPSPVSLQY
jgi:hypothetical protein